MGGIVHRGYLGDLAILCLNFRLQSKCSVPGAVGIQCICQDYFYCEEQKPNPN